MTFKLRKNATEEEIRELAEKAQHYAVNQTKKSGVDVKKYLGILEPDSVFLKESSLEIQKRIRNEWE